MRTLIGMAYPTKLLLKLADHTYVKCGTGKKAWACWGGKTGGRTIAKGTGSTKRANAIARANEKAGIKCYAINGVCHQAANRILLPAGVTVKDALGYRVSTSLFGTYGKVGYWLCRSPFNQFKNVTGDLKECVEKAPKARKARKEAPLTAEAKLEWQHLKGVLHLYDKAAKAERAKGAKAIKPADARAFQVEHFMLLADFHLGPVLDKALSKKLKEVRDMIERSIVKNEVAFKKDGMSANEFIHNFNETTIRFQNEMASILRAEHYETLFNQKREEKHHVILADPEILKKIYDIDLEALSKWYKMKK